MTITEMRGQFVGWVEFVGRVELQAKPDIFESFAAGFIKPAAFLLDVGVYMAHTLRGLGIGCLRFLDDWNITEIRAGSYGSCHCFRRLSLNCADETRRTKIELVNETYRP